MSNVVPMVDRRLAEAARGIGDGKLAVAAALCRQILADRPGTVEAWEMLGVAASGLGDGSAALEAFHRVVQLAPEHVSGLVNLGAVQATSGDTRAAVETFRRALAIAPDHQAAATFLVRALNSINQLDAALAAATEFTERQPGNGALAVELARLQLRGGRRTAAIATLEAAVARDDTNGAAFLLLGRLLKGIGRFEAALVHARRSIALNHQPAAAHSLAAELLTERGELDAALTEAREAVRCDGLSADAHRALALLLQRRGDRDGAIQSFEAAIARAPQRADLLTALADLQAKSGDRDGAIDSLRRALNVDSTFAEARTRLFIELRDVCRWTEAGALRPMIDAAVQRALDTGSRPPEAPFVDVMLHEDLVRNLAVARGWAREVMRRAEGLKRPEPRPRPAGSLLTVGYLSDELRDHPIGHHLAGLFARHDRSRVRVHVYSYGRDDGSEWARRARDGADSFVDISAVSAADAAQRIAQDGVDILVDAKGYTSNARLEILALRPAPIQVGWLGFPGSYGAPFIDYALGDRTVTPPEFQPVFDEALCCLPHTYQVNDDRLVLDAPPIDRATAGLPEHGFVFCCFNKPFKIPGTLFDLWLGILAEVPDSCLWLWGRDLRAIESMRSRAASCGVDPTRLVFAPKVPLTQHLKRLELADLALDSMPYNGHATTSNALWAGVPVVTVLGRHFASRVSASLLTAAGLTETIATDLADYRTRAVALAHDRDGLSRLRAKLQAARATAPFFDTGRFVRNLETAFEAMWARHAAGEAPSTLLIEER